MNLLISMQEKYHIISLLYVSNLAATFWYPQFTRSWHYIMQRLTAVIANLGSKQLLLFSFAWEWPSFLSDILVNIQISGY